jgi:hypothetical protein
MMIVEALLWFGLQLQWASWTEKTLVFTCKWRDFRDSDKIATVFLGTIGGTVVVFRLSFYR